MNTMYFNSILDDAARRRRLYEGQLFVYAPVPSSIALCQFADELIRKAFGNLSP